ncbi:hypothetical protein Q7C36_014384 [Tachysurus vachellii]|uniref:Myb/SANT-like DNA-binding domain-containing protein n=2 Tax=Tachysurus vachellii TaxID=175792 RepID=A0AA88MEV7_TACVA|nr:hypothetical protein Q7C36_014384 [Tachysurus vachellii]
MAGNWKDSETKELLSIRSDEEIIRQLNGTVRDAVVYEKITQKLKERGVFREKTQVINKLKTLRKKFHQIKQRNGQVGKSDWPYFDMCHYIWGGGRSANPMALLSPLEPYPSENDAETALSDTEILKTEVCTEFVPLSPAESPLSPQSPPNKSAKKVSRGEQMVKDMKEFFSEMDRDFEERERLRILEQRQYEESLRKEAKEEEKEERARQMAMFKELLESQNDLLRELLQRIPSSTSQWLTPSKSNGEPESTASVANNLETKECTNFVPFSHVELPQSPPNKRAKKVSKEEQIANDMKECFAEIAKTLEERERLRLLEQRQHEEDLRKEAKEEAREEQARQMAIFKEMQESQNGLLKELLRRMPSPALPQLNSSKYWNSGNQSRFNADTADNSDVQNTSENDMIFNPPSSTSFTE